MISVPRGQKECRDLALSAIIQYTSEVMGEVKVEVELTQPNQGRAIQARLRTRLGLRVRIVPLQPGTLPTDSGKARRVVDMRQTHPRRLLPDRRPR